MNQRAYAIFDIGDRASDLATVQGEVREAKVGGGEEVSSVVGEGGESEVLLVAGAWALVVIRAVGARREGWRRC